MSLFESPGKADSHQQTRKMEGCRCCALPLLAGRIEAWLGNVAVSQSLCIHDVDGPSWARTATGNERASSYCIPTTSDLRQATPRYHSQAQAKPHPSITTPRTTTAFLSLSLSLSHTSAHPTCQPTNHSVRRSPAPRSPPIELPLAVLALRTTTYSSINTITARPACRGQV